MGYQVTPADRAPLPAAYRQEERYLGYRAPERERPFARYFRPEMAPLPEHVRDALAHGRAPSELAYGVAEAPARLARPGSEPLETGWTRLGSGVVCVNVHTLMPGVTAEMWDWWFGWHGSDTARYKLWHPQAHQFAALGEDRSADRTLTDRQRYRNNVSYVDEYIGAKKLRLAIRFLEPRTLGFEEPPGTTYICSRISFTPLPLAVGWLIHQVRPTADGTEMRSRFYLNAPELIDLPGESISGPAPLAALSRLAPVANRVMPLFGPVVPLPGLGHDLLFHCAAEMNHLAAFLPALHEEFKGTP